MYQKCGGFLHVLPGFSTIKTDRHDIAEILLKVVLNTISLSLKPVIILNDFVMS
jgi:hypothetical protein